MKNVKNKLIEKYNFYSYSIVLFLIIFSAISTIFFLYRISLKKDLSYNMSGNSCGYFSKLKIYHDYSFFQKQKKYTNGHGVTPVTFPSNFNQNEKKTKKNNAQRFTLFK